MRDEEYFRRYTELGYLIEHGYVDYFVIKSAEDYNQVVQSTNQALPKDCFNILGHIIEVMKSDLALILWILTENSQDANRIGTLETYLIKGFNLRSTVSLSSSTKHFVDNELTDIRHHGLAHNSITKGNASITINSLKTILDEVREKYNSLCFPQVDDRVKSIDDSSVYSMEFRVRLGMNHVIRNSVLPIESNKGGPADA